MAQFIKLGDRTINLENVNEINRGYSAVYLYMAGGKAEEADVKLSGQEAEAFSAYMDAMAYDVLTWYKGKRVMEQGFMITDAGLDPSAFFDYQNQGGKRSAEEWIEIKKRNGEEAWPGSTK